MALWCTHTCIIERHRSAAALLWLCWYLWPYGFTHSSKIPPCPLNALSNKPRDIRLPVLSTPSAAQLCKWNFDLNFWIVFVLHIQQLIFSISLDEFYQPHHVYVLINLDRKALAKPWCWARRQVFLLEAGCRCEFAVWVPISSHRIAPFSINFQAILLWAETNEL